MTVRLINSGSGTMVVECADLLLFSFDLAFASIDIIL
jgi:hypothetical protein